MTLTEIIEIWVREAERLRKSPARVVVVTRELFADLVAEQQQPDPTVSGLAVRELASGSVGVGQPTVAEMIEIPGPDRISVYVTDPEESEYPLGLDPAMPVFFIPSAREHIDDAARLETYNSLRWYGLSPDDALAGSHQ